MLLSPRTPYLVGSGIIAILMSSLYRYSPMPGELSDRPARLSGVSTLEGCNSCHGENGLTQGCLEKETTHELYLDPDGTLTWVTLERDVHSNTSDPDKRQQEEQSYLQRAIQCAAEAKQQMAQ